MTISIARFKFWLALPHLLITQTTGRMQFFILSAPPKRDCLDFLFLRGALTRHVGICWQASDIGGIIWWTQPQVDWPLTIFCVAFIIWGMWSSKKVQIFNMMRYSFDPHQLLNAHLGCASGSELGRALATRGLNSNNIPLFVSPSS